VRAGLNRPRDLFTQAHDLWFSSFISVILDFVRSDIWVGRSGEKMCQEYIIYCLQGATGFLVYCVGNNLRMDRISQAFFYFLSP
jgi:hypothetical protein